MYSRLFVGCVFPLCMVLALAPTAAAQSDSSRVGSAFVPSDAVLTAVINVADSLNSAQAEMYPVEIADAWCQQNFGAPARQIDRVKLIVGAPGPGEPMFAAVVTFLSDVDLGAIKPQLVNTAETIEVDGHACYAVSAAPGMVMHRKDARTLVLASENYLGSVIRSSDASSSRGPLARMAESVSHSGNLTLLVAMEPIRPMVSGLLRAQAAEIPPPLQPFTKIPDLLDAVLIRINLEDAQNGLQLVMLSRDDAAASELFGILRDGLQMGRQMMLAQAMREVDPNDPMAEASQQYLQRISAKIVQMLTPTLEGRRLSLSGSATQGIATQGVLVSLLLPAVQAARQAARRTSSANQLKQIGLAMHNYYDVNRHFPTDILASDGTPLLSWRVAILPYLEESELYDQFKQDEPWDSPHNLKLAEQLPAVFVHPGIPTPPGTTVYQRPVGDGYLMDGEKAIEFRDITDGTSNTILAVETLGQAAVPWTKPADLSIDPENRLAELVDETRQGFNALFADGSVRFLANAIDPKLFQALLTRAGGEVAAP